MNNDKLHRERMLLLRYACERAARAVWKKGWRYRARLMERAAVFEVVCTDEQSKKLHEVRRTMCEAAIEEPTP